MSAQSPAPAAAPRRTSTPVLLGAATLLLAGLAALLWPRAAPKSDAEDPFEFAPPRSQPRGEPIGLRSSLAAGDRFEGSGTFAYRQSAAGRFGGMPLIPARDLAGTLTFTRRVEAVEGGRLRSTVEARLAYAEAPGAPVEATMTLSFEHGHVDTTSLPSTKLVAPDAVRPALELLAEAMTQRTPLVGRDARVGEAFVPKEAMDVEPMRRQLFLLLRFDGRGVAPVEGAVWLDGVSGTGDAGEATVRTWLRHAQTGASNDPFKDPMTTEYETVVRGLYRVGVADGLAHAVETRAARRMHFRSDAFDYRVRVDLAATIEEKRVK